MNLRKFLLQVDALTEQMTADQLKAVIHENGRLLSEAKRSDYLDRLKLFLSEPQSGTVNEAEKKLKIAEEFKKECVRLQKEICKIEEGELCIESEPNYEYNEWGDSDDEVFFSDPHGVGDVIEDACKYIHKCVDCEEYTYGYKIAERLIGLEICVAADEWDCYEPLSLAELESHDLLNVDYEQVVIDGLYLAYQANNLADRAEALYRMIENSHLRNMTLERVMQNGEELADITEFLPVWTAYLGRIPTRYAQNLLKEALELTEDPEILLSHARQFCEQHPALYEQYLDSVWNTEDSGKLFSVGNEALEKISVKYVVRSRIAKRLSLLALENGKKAEAEKYWLEVFRSETTVANYMRLFLESSDGNAFSSEIRRIYHSMYKIAGSSSSAYVQDGELKINRPRSETVSMLAFLGGEFQYVKECVMNVKNALGWSSTFMKCGLAAFLLLLLESGKLETGGREMCRRIVTAVNFDKNEYQSGTDIQNDCTSETLFWECFKKWKETFELSEAQKQEYIQWIEKLIKKRVAGIMEASRRNYYGECASYIAALGEVMESRGLQGAKQRIFLDYKELYFRRRSFLAELRTYGMIDTRKRG